MFGIKKELTNLLIDQVTSALEAKLQEFKEFVGSNDDDDINDIDQLIEKIKGFGDTLKNLHGSVDIQAVFDAFDLITAGFAKLMEAFDKEKFSAAATAIKKDIEWLGLVFKASMKKLKEKHQAEKAKEKGHE